MLPNFAWQEEASAAAPVETCILDRVDLSRPAAVLTLFAAVDEELRTCITALSQNLRPELEHAKHAAIAEQLVYFAQACGCDAPTLNEILDEDMKVLFGIKGQGLNPVLTGLNALVAEIRHEAEPMRGRGDRLLGYLDDLRAKVDTGVRQLTQCLENFYVMHLASVASTEALQGTYLAALKTLGRELDRRRARTRSTAGRRRWRSRCARGGSTARPRGRT